MKENLSKKGNTLRKSNKSEEINFPDELRSGSQKNIYVKSIYYKEESLNDVDSPKFLSEDYLKSLPLLDMPRGEVVDGQLMFKNPDDFLEILRLGMFLVKVPKDLDITPVELFSNNWYKEKINSPEIDKYRGFKEIFLDGKYEGYEPAKSEQVELLNILEENWERVLPKELYFLTNQMTDFGISILRSILNYLQIPQRLWLEITGGLSEKKGQHVLAVNHYRSDKSMMGGYFHTDSGWITILKGWEPGLVVWVNNKLYAANPEPGYFIINFGKTFEVLTSKLGNPVQAVIHGIAKTVRAPSQPDRVTYVLFLSSNQKSNIYQLDSVNNPRFIQTADEFLAYETDNVFDIHKEVVAKINSTLL